MVVRKLGMVKEFINTKICEFGVGQLLRGEGLEPVWGEEAETFETFHIEWTLDIVHLSHHHIYDMKLNLRIVVVV